MSSERLGHTSITLARSVLCDVGACSVRVPCCAVFCDAQVPTSWISEGFPWMFASPWGYPGAVACTCLRLNPGFSGVFFIACICARLPCGCTSARLGAKLGMFDLLMRCFFVVGTCYPCCQSRSSQRGSHAWPRPSINSMASGNHCDYRDNLAEKALEQNSAVSDMHKLLEH